MCVFHNAYKSRVIYLNNLVYIITIIKRRHKGSNCNKHELKSLWVQIMRGYPNAWKNGNGKKKRNRKLKNTPSKLIIIRKNNPNIHKTRCKVTFTALSDCLSTHSRAVCTRPPNLELSRATSPLICWPK